MTWECKTHNSSPGFGENFDSFKGTQRAVAAIVGGQRGPGNRLGGVTAVAEATHMSQTTVRAASRS